MDDIVKQALAKWPNVPDCYGWLGLDARGNWYMRDDRTQAAGAFPRLGNTSKESKGSLLQHEKLIEFIQRNYAVDAKGQWFFQNGPQRVYVELEATPWIWRVGRSATGADFAVTSHAGATTAVLKCLVDELGRVYLQTSIGVGLVHTQDVACAADAIEAGLWMPEDVIAATLAERFGFVPSPQSLQGNPNGSEGSK